jgi:hypothetical protein
VCYTWNKFHRSASVRFGNTNIFVGMLIPLSSEEWPASHKICHSVSSGRLGCWAQRLVVVLTSWQTVNQPNITARRTPAAAFLWFCVEWLSPALGPTQPPVRWVPGVLSPGVKRDRVVMLTTHPHLVPRSWMSRSYISSPYKRLHGV